MATIAEVWYEEGKQEGEREGERKGERKGIRKGKLEIARTMLVKGMEISLITEITGLKEEQITQNSSNGYNGSQ